MNTQCTPAQLEFHAFGRREVVARFDAGRLTSDGGGILLREVDRQLGLMAGIARCFADHRDPRKVGTRRRSWWRSGCTGSRWATRI